MTTEKKSRCTGCQMCHRQTEADLVCTYILEGSEKEKACWCVCPSCLPKFQEISGFYDSLLTER